MRHLDRRQFVALGATGVALSSASGPALARKATRPTGAPPLKLPVRISGNENPWGPGPAARAAIAASTDEACRYGLDAYAELADSIAKREGVDKDRVLIASGSGELLHMLAVAYCDRGQLVCAWPTFSQMMAYAEKFGCEIRKVPLDQAMKHDLPALSAALTPNSSLLYICNPNNPTGTVIAAEPLRAFVREMQQRALVVADEAYLDLVEAGSTESLVGLVRENLNVVVLRTFSKIHGLAGLRVGYAVAPPAVIQRLRRYAMTIPATISMRAAAASMGDSAFLASTRKSLLDDRARVCGACDELGLEYANPQGNFVFMNVRMPADDFRRKMLAEQIQVGRAFEPYANWSRVSIGTTAETSYFIEALRKIARG